VLFQNITFGKSIQYILDWGFGKKIRPNAAEDLNPKVTSTINRFVFRFSRWIIVERAVQTTLRDNYNFFALFKPIDSPLTVFFMNNL